jgi:hypothetical protein
MEGKITFRCSQKGLGQPCLSSILVYLLSFKFPEWALKLLDTQLANFMWNDEEGNKKMILA